MCPIGKKLVAMYPLLSTCTRGWGTSTIVHLIHYDIFVEHSGKFIFTIKVHFL